MSARYGSRTRTGEAVSGFGRAGGGGSAPIAPISATGGQMLILPDHVVHVFTGSGDFEVLSGSTTVGYAIVAGGGGGGFTQRNMGGATGGNKGYGGGGGAGGVLSGTTPVSPGTYPIVVGAGGAYNTNGSNSTGFSQTALGGGYGGGYRFGTPFSPTPGTVYFPANPGGSGGSSGGQATFQSPGGGYADPAGPTGTGTPGQGNPGSNHQGGSKSPTGKGTPLVSLAPPALPLAPSSDALSGIGLAQGGFTASRTAPYARWETTTPGLWPVAGVANTGNGGNHTATIPNPQGDETLYGTNGGSGVVYVWYARV